MSYETIINNLSPYITIFASAIVGFIAWSIKKIFIEKISLIDVKLGIIEKEFNQKIKNLNDNLSIYKEEMLRYYVRKEDFNDNHEAHEKIWIELNQLRERVARLEK